MDGLLVVVFDAESKAYERPTRLTNTLAPLHSPCP